MKRRNLLKLAGVGALTVFSTDSFCSSEKVTPEKKYREEPHAFGKKMQLAASKENLPINLLPF